jgi:hypothetical protein
VPPKLNLFFATSQFDWAITQKEVKPWKLAKIEGFIFEFLPFGSPIYVKGVQHLPKHMG